MAIIKQGKAQKEVCISKQLHISYPDICTEGLLAGMTMNVNGLSRTSGKFLLA